jgi:hypothetical protein
MTPISSEQAPSRLSEARIEQLVQTKMQQYRHRKQRVKRIVASFTFIGLLFCGNMVYQLAQVQSTSEPIFNANSDDWEMAVATLLAESDVRDPAIHAVIMSLHSEDSLEQQLAKIQALPNVSAEALLYHQALAYLKHGQKEHGIKLLRQLPDGHQLKKQAFKTLNLAEQIR